MQATVQVVYYQKNTGSTTKDVPHCTPITYRILKTRANDGITDIQPEKHGSRAQICSGGTVDPKIWTFLHFLTSRTTPLDPTGRQKHVRKMGKVVFFRKNTGSTTKDTLGKWRLKKFESVRKKKQIKKGTRRLTTIVLLKSINRFLSPNNPQSFEKYLLKTF